MNSRLRALLRELYPAPPVALRLLTSALRPACAHSIAVQPDVLAWPPREPLVLLFKEEVSLPDPLYFENRQHTQQRQNALRRLHHDLESLNQHGPDANLEQRVEHDRATLVQLGLPREAQP